MKIIAACSLRLHTVFLTFSIKESLADCVTLRVARLLSDYRINETASCSCPQPPFVMTLVFHQYLYYLMIGSSQGKV